ncbi:hypothetical protein [Kribbella catacumbae]|uniref:hypothetical protein n=1 Tax=Kribbella catacumbae TaxID=460086 RepID=UPI000361A83D|nr:hypothetical protein [Kribbella catacumbae]
MEWSNITWFLTALGAVVVLLTRVRLGGDKGDDTARPSGVASFSSALVRIHTTVGVLTLIVWVVALVIGRREIAFGALAGWWALSVVGLLLLARWLPSASKHAKDKATDAWGSGAGLSLLGHVGMVVGVTYFSFVTFTDRL